MAIQKIIILAITLCISLGVLYYTSKNNSAQKNSVYIYNLAWLVFVFISMLDAFTHIDFVFNNKMKILFFILGLMTTESGLFIVMGHKQNEVAKSKRKSVMQKIPWLGAFAYLTVLNELGVNTTLWFHWATHLSILVIFQLRKDLKGIYLYSIGTLFLSIFYFLHMKYEVWIYFTAVFSFVTLFVTMAMLESLKENNEQITNLHN